MKHRYIFIALFLFPLLAFGQYDQSGNLTIFSESGDKFYLVLNGEQQNDVPQTNIRIEDLGQPYYSTRIIFADKRLPDITKNLQVTDMTGNYMDVVYKIQRKAGHIDLNYFSMAPVPKKYVAPANMYVMRYGRHSKEDHDRDRRDRYRHHDDRDRYDDPYPMDSRDFAQAKEAVRNATFSDAMLSTAKSILLNNYLSTEQVIELCRVFNFDDPKLAFAKAAYARTVDPENYFKVANVFSFSSSKEELNNMISANNNAYNDDRRGPRYKKPMDATGFAQARQTIKNGSFDATMVSTARSIISGNYFTAEQVLELCRLFSYDESKLEVAKAAYPRTVDQANFFKVGNALSFSSSKEELNNFISDRH